MNLSSLSCWLTLTFLVACDRNEPNEQAAPTPQEPLLQAPAPQPKGEVKREEDLTTDDLDEDGFPRKELLDTLPEEIRKGVENARLQKQKAEAYLRFAPPDQSSEVYRQAESTCAPMPASWPAPGVRTPYKCEHCVRSPLPIPRCQAGLKAQPINEALLSSAEENEVVLTVRGHLGPDHIKWVGTAVKASYSTPWLLSGATSQSPRLFVQLDTENLSATLKHLPESPWLTSSGTLFCQGTEELCCPFDFAQKGLPMHLAITGKIRKLDRYYPDARPQVTDRAILAQSICRL